MYEVMEYTIMSDVYDEYIDMHPAIEAFGKKKGKNIFQRIWQKILEIIRSIKEKISKFFNRKKTPPILQRLKQIPLFNAIVNNKKKTIGIAAVAATSITAVIAGVTIWKKTKKKPEGLDTKLDAAENKVELLEKEVETQTSEHSESDNPFVSAIAASLSGSPEADNLKKATDRLDSAAHKAYEQDMISKDVENREVDPRVEEFERQAAVGYDAVTEKLTDLLNRHNTALSSIKSLRKSELNSLKAKYDEKTDEILSNDKFTQHEKVGQYKTLKSKYLTRKDEIVSRYDGLINQENDDYNQNYDKIVNDYNDSLERGRRMLGLT